MVWLTGEMEKGDSIDASEAGVSRVLYHERAKPRVWPLTSCRNAFLGELGNEVRCFE